MTENNAAPADSVDEDLSMFLVDETPEEAPEEEQEQPEAEVDETDDEADPEEVAEDEDAEGEEEDEEADEPAPRTFQVRAGTDENGAPIIQDVDETELIAGYQRHRDYTQKTQAIAEERRAQREAHEAALAQWAIQEQAEPDWGAYLKQGYSAEQVMQAQIQWQQKKRVSDQAKQEFQNLRRQADEEAMAERKQQAEAAKERLMRDIPEWSDPKVAAKEVQELASVAVKDYRLTGEELAGITDDRMVRILRDAVKFRKLQGNNAAISKRKIEPGKTLRPGAKVPAKQRSKRKEQEISARLRKTGSTDDFVAWLTN